MKILSLLTFITFFCTNVATAAANFRAVFELTSSDEKTWDGILGNVKNAREALKEVEIEVVAHSEGIGLVTKGNKKFRQEMKALSDKGVRFRACQNTMESKDIELEELIPFVTPVDSGVAEIIRKQQDGWSYVKVGK